MILFDRMAVKKVIGGILKNSRPYSRGEVATALAALDKKVSSNDVRLSRIEQKRLAHLMRIFAVEKKGSQLNLRFDNEYLLQTQGETYRFGLSMEAGETIVNRNLPVRVRTQTGLSDTTQQTGYITLLRPTVTGQVRDSFAFYSDLKFYYLTGATFPDIPKTEARIGQAGLDAATAGLATSYAKFKLPWFELLLGKENLSWGPGRHGALLISDNPLPMNMVKLVAWYKQIKFHAFTSILGSGDLDIFLLKNLEFYGELLMDDFYPNYGLRSPFNWGSKLGILLGFYYVNPFSMPNTDLRIEYTFVNQYTYTHDPMDTTYTHYDAVIGHHIGADADDLFIDVRHWFTDKLWMAMGYELQRHGEGDVNKPHPTDAPRDDEWEFLSGVTESTNSLSLGLSYATIGRYFADLKYTVSWVRNAQNKLSENSTRHQFILNGSYRF